MADGARHIVLMRWKPGVSDNQADEIARALAALPDRIDGLRSLFAGPDLGLVTGNADFAVVADLDNEDGWRADQDDPEHRRIVSEMIAPALDQRTALQVRHP